jgi:predicted alpha-1,2-mannosidase
MTGSGRRPLAERLEKRVLLSAMNLTPYVNPFLGTASTPNAPGSFTSNSGDVFPGAVVPFGMVQFSPDTSSDGSTPDMIPGGYWYPDSVIRGFSLTHFSGRGVAYETDLGFMPVNGAVSGSTNFNFNSEYAGFSHGNESASPGYYSVTLNSGVKVELSATTRTGQMQDTFSSSATTGSIFLNLQNSNAGYSSDENVLEGSTGGAATIVNSNEIQGYADGTTSGGQIYQVYYDAVFDQPVIAFGTWNGSTLTPGSTTTSFSNNSGSGGAYVSFNTTSNKVVHASIGISYVSIANAALNRTTEVPSINFSSTVSAANSAWNAKLNTIQITDPNASVASLTTFYTELYHTMIDPSIFQDVNGQYYGFDGQIHTVPAGHNHFTNISGWDIYRTESPLLAFVLPNTYSDEAQSLLDDAAQNNGLIPRWVQNAYDSRGMIGDGGSIIVDDAYAFGATNFNTSAAVTYINNNGTEIGGLRENLNQYVSSGYVYDYAAETEEYAISDAADALFFKSVGQTSLYNTYLTRAQNWKNNFDPSNLSINSKDSNGNWDSSGTGWIEGTQSQYTWMLPFNLAVLINDMGGPGAVNPRLNTFFTQLNGGSSSQYEYIGNENDESQPWTYDYTGEPYQTQNIVRQAEEVYADAPSGMPGNDDGGAMSSWYVFACLGIYPMTSGAGNFIFGSPMFASATVTTETGHVLQINGNNAGVNNPYVQDMSINGVSNQTLWMPVSTILNNATTTLSFDLGSSPSMVWGSTAADAPPSYDVASTTPTIATAAAASSTSTTASTVGLSVLGADTAAAGESGLTYTWTTIALPSGAAAPTFSSTNGLNSGKNVTATFYAAGNYTFQVSVSNGANSVTSSVPVNVLANPQLTISPATATINPGGTLQLTARVADQFGNTISSPAVSWSVLSGGGSVTSTGLFTAASTTGTAVVQATSNSNVSGNTSAVVSISVASDVTNGLIAHWTFDEGSGTSVYNSAPDGIANTGTLSSGVTWVSPGRIGSSALSFNGNSYQNVEVPDASDLDPTNGLSISAWIYPLDWNGNRRIVQKGNINGVNYGDDQYRLTAENNVLKFELYLLNNGTYSPINVTASLPSIDAWHFVVGTWDGTNLNLYVDNTLVGTNASAVGTLPAYENSTDPTGPLFIGEKNNAGNTTGNTFSGTIDDVRIFNRAITAAEVTKLFNQQNTASLLLTGPANYLKRDGDGVHLDVWNTSAGPAGNAPYNAQVLISAISSISFLGSTAADHLTLDFSNGDLLTGTETITYAGGGSGNNSLTIIGSTSANDTISVNGANVQVDARPIVLSNVQQMSLAPGNGTDALSLNASSLSLSIPAGNAALFSSITINAGALSVTTTASGHATVVTSGLTLSGSTNNWTSQLDLGNADLILHAGNLTQTNSQIVSGYHRGTWTGNGITSSSAAADTAYLTALGMIVEPAATNIDNQPVNAGDIVFKFTYYGDTDFNGKVDGSDYSRIDYGYLHHLTGWTNGDFNYDGVIDGSDYTLMDNAFNRQGAILSAVIAAKIAPPAVAAIPSASNPPMITPSATSSGDDELNSRKKNLLSDDADALLNS